jgi:GTPase Era involved in 16S rRNA processing
MDQTDDAPGVGAPSDASVNSDTHQRTVPVAVMQMPSTADSAASANPSILGPSMLRTPKVTQPQVPHKSCSPTTDDDFPQKSTEPLAADKYLTESGDTKKRKFKDESMEEMMQGQTFNELFVGPNEPFAVPLKGKTKLRRLDSTISPEVHAIVSDLSAKFLLRLQQIESEPDELPVAPQHLACSSDGRVRAYNPADEKKFFNVSIDRPSYGKAIKMRKAIVEFILDGMEALDKFHEEWMDNENRVFRKKFLANASSKKSNKHARSVGLIGDPGVGKSMLLNNLLNILNAALSKSSRKSTTNVRHEYVCTNPQSSAPYVAVVHALDKRTIDTKVQEQVRKVLEFRDYDQDTPSDEYDQTQHDKLKQAKGTALEYLASLVVAPDAELEFRQESSLDNYIMGGEEREVVRTLSSCIDAYRLSQGCFGPTGKTTFTANSIGQLVAKPGLRQFENYTKHSSDARARWRLVEKVTCYLDAFILEHDVTVIDYPGTNLDNDQTRDENGQEGIKSCDVIVLLVKYERSRDSKTLEDTLRKCIRLGKIVKLCVGHLDSFKDNDPLADEEEEDPELLEICALEDEYEADPERMRELMSLKYSRRLEVRGASYAKEMKDYYSDLQKQETGCEGAELQVYPLLNREHAFYVKGFNINADPGRRPGVALEKTGVASLLFDIYGLPAETMLREESRLKFNLESLSIAAKLYCVSSKLERKQLIEHFVNEPRGVCARKVDNLVADLKKKMKEALDAVVLERQKAWSKAGKKLSDKWATKHHSNYLSFCKNSGSHQTAGEREEWNEDVHQIIHGDLVRTFEKVWAIVKRSKEDFYRCVTDLMKGITTNLKGESRVAFGLSDYQY